MKYLKFKIDIYDWDIHYIETENKKDADNIIRKLSQLRISDEMKKEVREEIENDVINGGEHFWNSTTRLSILLLYKTSNKEEKINIICHEKRHTEDRICEHLGIKDTEAVAFIAGYIGERIISFALKLIKT